MSQESDGQTLTTLARQETQKERHSREIAEMNHELEMEKLKLGYSAEKEALMKGTLKNGEFDLTIIDLRGSLGEPLVRGRMLTWDLSQGFNQYGALPSEHQFLTIKLDTGYQATFKFGALQEIMDKINSAEVLERLK